MAPTLQFHQASETVNNQAGTGPSTIPVIDTPDTANNGNDEAVEADGPNDTDKDLEAVTAHKQEIIDHQ